MLINSSGGEPTRSPPSDAWTSAPAPGATMTLMSGMLGTHSAGRAPEPLALPPRYTPPGSADVPPRAHAVGKTSVTSEAFELTLTWSARNLMRVKLSEVSILRRALASQNPTRQLAFLVPDQYQRAPAASHFNLLSLRIRPASSRFTFRLLTLAFKQRENTLFPLYCPGFYSEKPDFNSLRRRHS